MSIDLNALAAQLASQLAAAPVPMRQGGEAPRASAAPQPLPPPRGVRFTAGEVRLGDVLDHTLLRPDATIADIERLCAEARDHRLASVCVNSVWVADAVRLLRGSKVAVASVIGFPSGAVPAEIKAAEAALAVKRGATELDLVVPLGALRAGLWDDVERDVAEVVAAADGALVKAIVESAILTPMALVKACLTVREGGADYVKTSTGFHSAGGATPETVALMRLALGDSMGVKASGGIRDGAAALAMLAAGATRIGTSAGAAIAEVTGPGPRRLSDLVADPAPASMAGSSFSRPTAPARLVGDAPAEQPVDGRPTAAAEPAEPSRQEEDARAVTASHQPVPETPSRTASPTPNHGAPVEPAVARPAPLPGSDPTPADRWRPLGTPFAGQPAVPPPETPAPRWSPPAADPRRTE